MKTNLIAVFESDSGHSLQKMYAEYLGLSIPELKGEFLSKFLDDFSSKYSAGYPEDDEDNRLTVSVNNLDQLRQLLVAFRDVKQTVFLEQRINGAKVSYGIMNKEKLRRSHPEWNTNLDVYIDLEKAGVELQGRINEAIDLLKGK